MERLTRQEEETMHIVWRVVMTLPKWKPGEEKGKMVAVKYTIPVGFRP